MKLLTLLLTALSVPDSAQELAIAQRVEIVRTEYGVPHILAEDLEAMGFALGWLQSEDHGDVAALALVMARGEYARFVGHDSIEFDFANRPNYERAVATYHRLLPETRAVYDGFAAGVNHYVRMHPTEFPDWLEPSFTGMDAHAREIQSWSRGDARRFVRWLERQAEPSGAGPAGGEGEAWGDDGAAWGLGAPAAEEPDFDLDGSNAWAFAPSRTHAGHAILLRNPHLTWGAGYYEAHVRVPGVLEFYGDFRIGGAFGIIGGFNRHLGWATTNNSPTYSQVYALEVDRRHQGHFLLDGLSHPIQERDVTVTYRTAGGELAAETRTTRHTAFGPVILETDETVYILKDPRDGEFRRGEQFLRMMMTENLEEWLDVMTLRAHPSSNFTYADADGNIVHFYNARIPLLPHEPTGDSAAVARRVQDMWSELVPVSDLPFWLNPPGGYVQQANDTPDYTNVNVTVDRDTLPPNLPPQRLRPRSQLSVLLAQGSDQHTLEDVVELKHSPRMLVAERMMDDLLNAVESAPADPVVQQAGEVLAAWDRTAAAGSRGGVLFKAWFRAYAQRTDTTSFFRERWTPERPMETPVGLGDPAAALDALRAAVATMEEEGRPLDVAWGDVHRVIRGEVDEPVSGCSPTLGCFRTLSFERTDDGRLAANRGDAWVFAVEFADVPRAYSILAYGQSPREDSPHHADQAALFARGEMKPVAWRNEDIRQLAIRRYRPGGPDLPLP